MVKKKQNVVDEPEVDLKALIRQNTVFFDKLIDLIPAKFYLPNDDKEKVWFHGLSKEEQALAKQKTRENTKKSRRLRLDPENSSATTRDLLMQNLKTENAGNDIEDEATETNHPVLPDLEDDERSVTYEELRQRLRRKIEELRSQRGGSDNNAGKKNEKAKEKGQQKKRKRESESEDKKPPTGSSMENVEKDAEEATRELKFSNVKLGNEEDHGKKKRKLTKLQKLEKANALEAAKRDPEKGSSVEEKHSWKAATSKAAGIKVPSVEGLTKKIKKEKKKHQKSVKEWKERVESQQKVKSDRQEKRSQNIAEKINQKKMKRIEKREKKLMRPGFEGRKADYINGDNSGGSLA